VRRAITTLPAVMAVTVTGIRILARSALPPDPETRRRCARHFRRALDIAGLDLL
jgi:hypothetical protein